MRLKLALAILSILCLIIDSVGQEGDERSKTAIQVAMGPSYTGWNAELGVMRSFDRIDFGLFGRYVFGGNVTGTQGSWGLSLLGDYRVIRNEKISVFVGPTLGWIWVQVPKPERTNRYMEAYANIGIHHHLSPKFSLGYMVGYGTTVASLYDRFDDDRYSVVSQSSTLKLILTYHL